MLEEAAAAAGGSASSEDQWRPDPPTRKARFPRACTTRAPARFHSSPAAGARPSPAAVAAARREREERQQNARIVTPLARPPSPSQLPRWSLRSMWELASLFNFLHVFRPLLNIGVEFTAEELESALIMPNSTLDDIHIPLLKAIPPVTRMALGRATWVTVLCRKLRDWWHWVADGEVPIVASHGLEVEAYKSLDPGMRVLILKALCDIRVEQDDIRSYIENSIKHGIQLSAFRRERIGGDSHGVSFWYEDDPIIGHRLYREIRRAEVTKVKGKAALSLPLLSCHWETVATSLDEFEEVSDKLLSSKNRTEAALGKRLRNDILPEIEKIHKRKEKLLKKQHRQALLLDSFLTSDGISSGRALRDRKPVTYTFDDYDKSINEAIKITKKKQLSPEHVGRRETVGKLEASSNGKWNGPPQVFQHASDDTQSLKSEEYEESDGEHHTDPLDRSNRQRKRPQRYSEKEFVEVLSDNDADFDSDDDIVGEAVYDEEYLRNRKQKVASSSDGDEEYRWEEENVEDEEEEGEDSLSVSEEMEERDRLKKFPTRSRRATKLRSVDEIQSGLRRSKRSTRPRINYRQYEVSGSDTESGKPDKSNPSSDAHSDASNDLETSSASQESQDEANVEKSKDHETAQDYAETVAKEEHQQIDKPNSPDQQGDGSKKRRFLDLNELAPGNGFEDGSSTMMKDEDPDI